MHGAFRNAPALPDKHRRHDPGSWAEVGDGQLRVREGMIANESPVRAIRTLGSAGGGVNAVKVETEVPARSRKPLATTTRRATFDRRGSPRRYRGRAPLHQRGYTRRIVGDLLRLLDHFGGAQGVLLGGGIAWILFELRSQKARAKEDREAADRRFRKFSEDADRRFREFSEDADRRAREDRESAENRAREDRESTRVLLREHSESTKKHLSEHSKKNDAEHARLFALVDEVKTKVEVLLDRSKRPESGGSAD